MPAPQSRFRGAGRRTWPRVLVLPVVLLAALSARPAIAQVPGFGKPLREDAPKASASLHARVEGEQVRVAIPIAIEAGWHLYHDEQPKGAIGLPTTVTLRPADVAWSAVRFPEPHRVDQSELGGTHALTHEGAIVLYAVGRAEGGVDPASVEAALEGLTCQDDGSCIPWSQEVGSAGPGPDDLFAAFPADLRPRAPGEGPSNGGGLPGGDGATAEGARLAREGAAGAGEAADDVDWAGVEFPAYEPRIERPERGLVAWLLVAFVAGMILNVMPCVLPVISIKVLSFVQQAGEDKARVLALGLAFAAGILLVFLVLAGLAAFAGQSWGQQFQSQPFLIVMIGIVFAFALSLFGVYDLGVPAGVGALAGSAPREGLGDAFFKGMLATALATPCSGPFLGSTLTWAVSQPAATIFAVFTMLGLGMALPYVVLTANPRLLKLVPRPGAWMDTFKQAMGFVLLATVVYLMISLRQDVLLFTVAFLVFVALGCWWWGRFSPRAPSRGRRLVTLVVALLIVAAGGHLSFRTLQGAFAPGAGEGWETFDPLRMQALLGEGRSVFVDFTADWCPNCKWNEKFVYEADAVQAALSDKGVVAMKADITHKGPRTDMIYRLMDALGGSGSIPFMAVFPGDEPGRPHVRFDIVAVDDMLAILADLP